MWRVEKLQQHHTFPHEAPWAPFLTFFKIYLHWPCTRNSRVACSTPGNDVFFNHSSSACFCNASVFQSCQSTSLSVPEAAQIPRTNGNVSCQGKSESSSKKNRRTLLALFASPDSSHSWPPQFDTAQVKYLSVIEVMVNDPCILNRHG
jgi:hypothetical protein